MAELVDATDLKSVDPQGSCRFESGLGHHLEHDKKGKRCMRRCDQRIKRWEARRLDLGLPQHVARIIELPDGRRVTSG